MSTKPWLANSQLWGLSDAVLASIDDVDPMDLEALELYEKARQGLSRAHLEETES